MPERRVDVRELGRYRATGSHVTNRASERADILNRRTANRDRASQLVVATSPLRRKRRWQFTGCSDPYTGGQIGWRSGRQMPESVSRPSHYGLHEQRGACQQAVPFRNSQRQPLYRATALRYWRWQRA